MLSSQMLLRMYKWVSRAQLQVSVVVGVSGKGEIHRKVQRPALEYRFKIKVMKHSVPFAVVAIEDLVDDKMS